MNMKTKKTLFYALRVLLFVLRLALTAVFFVLVWLRPFVMWAFQSLSAIGFMIGLGMLFAWALQVDPRPGIWYAFGGSLAMFLLSWLYDSIVLALSNGSLYLFE